ncbi:MAG: CDP-alcohol phosphatidyltransferase family protein [Holosporales bacterium]|jgi:CDP-diacylglycerol--glycerol-3-phosphate 3-phosphatidyltransferase|nr:CDP-alcohol phosphatidyltransferase family protein [Holosporales bacterium]
MEKPIKIKQHVPNALSFFRLLLSPVFFALLQNKSQNEILLVIILIIGITDFLDGYLARKFKVSSKFGEILDPLADKIFLNTACWGVYLYKCHTAQMLALSCILTVRDIILVLGGLFSMVNGFNKKLSPIFLSKFCTTFMFILFIISITSPSSIIQLILSNIAIVLIIITSYFYIKRFIKPQENS